MKKESKEDKALLQIRIETLKTMIGKMKENQFGIKTSLPVKPGYQVIQPSAHVLNSKLMNNSNFKTNFVKTSLGDFHNETINNINLKTYPVDKYKWVKKNNYEKKIDINRNTSNINNVIKSCIPVTSRNNLKFYSERNRIINKNNNTSSDSLSLTSRLPSSKSFITENSKCSDVANIQVKKVCNVDLKNYNESSQNAAEKIIPPKVVWVRTTAKKPMRTHSLNYQTHLPIQSKPYKNTYRNENQIKKQSHHLLSKYKFVRNKQLVPSVSNFMTHSMLRRINEKKFIWRRRSLEIKEKSIIKRGRNTFIVKRFQAVQRSRDADLYRLNSSQLSKNTNIQLKSKEVILTRHGYNFKLASNLKSLKRVNFTTAGHSHPGGQLTVKLQPPFHKRLTLQKTSKLYLASCVLKKTINRVQCQKKGQRNYCLFYSRFGKCKRGENCHYIHDPEKVAVCTRFLRGTCKDKNCIFSHKFDPNKMPVCSYFLLGQCTRDKCPYRHVNVSSSAPICEAFVKGFCPNGEKCTKKHTLECEEFLRSGICSKRKSCRLVHRIKIKRGRTVSVSGLRRPQAFIKNKSSERLGGVLSPLKDSGRAHLLPSFLNLKSDSIGSINKASSSSLKSLFAPDATVVPLNSYTDDATILSDADVDNQQVAEISAKDHIEFIPLKCSFSDESDDESENEPRYTKQFSFKEQDFISLE
uniref:Zinc finger CCCH domain-containing protein 3 n=1 Tax=Hydra vulgaris TaxID=6087 RepID=T2MA34_HYDVU